MKKAFPVFLSVVFAAASLFARGISYVDFTVSGYSGHETLTNFPVLVRLSTAIRGFDYNRCAPDGADLSFYIGETELPREIDRWDPDGESLVWVRVPELKAGTTFRAYFCDKNVTSQPACQTDGCVWKPAGYIGVWHMDELDARDSTALGNDGTLLEPIGAADPSTIEPGRIGSGQFFGGESKVDCGTALDTAYQNGFSVEGWVKSKFTDGKRSVLGREHGFVAKFEGNSFRIVIPYDAEYVLGGNLVAGEWTHAVFSFCPEKAVDGAKAYQNGTLLQQASAGHMKPLVENSRLFLGSNEWGENYFGVLDELRVSKVVPTADWVLASYETVEVPDFLTPGVVHQTPDVLEVVCNPFLAATGFVPELGVHGGMTSGKTFECSAPTGEITVGDSIRAHCKGWKIYCFDSEQGAFRLDESRDNATGTGTSFTYRHPDPAALSRLEWQMVISNRVTAAVNDEARGTVDHPVTWLRQGDTITITAEPKAGYAFRQWMGDIQGNALDSQSITLKADKPLSVTAMFVTTGQVVLYVSPDGDDENNSGLSEQDPFKTLSCALRKALPGEQISLAEGTYPLKETMVLDKKITVTGAGVDKTVFTRANEYMRSRFFRLDHPDAVLENVTVLGARQDGGDNQFGNGVFIDAGGGTMRFCRVTECESLRSYHRGAVAVASDRGVVSHCRIDHNRTLMDGNGGGLYTMDGLVDNCLVDANEAGRGGGIYYRGGLIRNCTFAGNSALREGGGLHWYSDQAEGGVAFQNVIFARNSAPDDAGKGAPEWHDERPIADGRILNCLFGSSIPVGTGSIMGDPAFVDAAHGDYSLASGSIAIDVGLNYPDVAATDFAGEDRVQNGTVDIGCYEFVQSDWGCGFTVEPFAILSGENVTLTASTYGAPDVPLTYDWTLRNANRGNTFSLTGEAPSEPIAEPGWYDVTLMVGDGAGHSVSYTRPSAFHVVAKTSYLAAPGASSPAYPWDTLETASTNLHELVDEAIDGSRIVMLAGDYKLSDEIYIDKAVTLSGAGMDKTVFSPVDQDMKKRLFYLNHPDSVLEGVTVSNAVNQSNSHGNGVRIGAQGGTLRGSRVTCCSGGSWKNGGVNIFGKNGVVTHCVVDHNYNEYGSGGGFYLENGRVENCLLYANTSFSGGGFFVQSGAKVTIRNCTVVDNTALHGCGGGLNWKTYGMENHVQNVIFARNKAPTDTVEPGRPEWGTEGSENCLDNLKASVENCLFADSIVIGNGCVTGDPLFKDPDHGDYTINRKSPAYNAGLYGDWMVDEVDLAGNPRVDHKQLVDIGCYEVPYAAPATMLMLR